MNTRSSTWSVVLAFGDPRRCVAAPGVTRETFHEAACLDTLETVLNTVEPTHVSVITDVASVAAAARHASARVIRPGRDMTTDVNAAMAAWAEEAPERSGVIVMGPLPYARSESLFAALRACAAAESAVIVADDGGTVALSHHDPARLSPRFGGASAARHARGAVRVAQHVDGLQRTIQTGRSFPGKHLTALMGADDDQATREESA